MNIPKIIKRLHLYEKVGAGTQILVKYVKYPKLFLRLYRIMKDNRMPINLQTIIPVICYSYDKIFKFLFHELIITDYINIKWIKYIYKTHDLRRMTELNYFPGNNIHNSLFALSNCDYSISRYLAVHVCILGIKYNIHPDYRSTRTSIIFVKKECKLLFGHRCIYFEKCTKKDLIHYNLTSIIVRKFTSKNLFNLSRWFSFVV